jgi:hypothetical protein
MKKSRGIRMVTARVRAKLSKGGKGKIRNRTAGRRIMRT